MKVLFALNQNKETVIENKILSYYTSLTGEEFEFKKEYDISGVANKLRLEAFDILVINEELERNNTVTTTFIDDLTDRLTNIRVILIAKSDHGKDSYIRRLFNLGVYDILYSNEISIESITNLIIGPRSKGEAKIYLDLHDIDDVMVEEELNYIPKEEVYNIVDYFKLIDHLEIENTFNHICSQYNENQITYLIGLLPNEIRKVLEESGNEKYLSLKSSHSEDETSESKELIYIEEKESTEKANTDSVGRFKLPKFNLPQRKITEEKVVTKIEKKYVSIIPDDYRKVVVLLGGRKSGTTTITSLLASYYAKEKRILVIDVAKNGLFSAKSWGNEDIVIKDTYKELHLEEKLKIIQPMDNNTTLDLIEKYKYDNDIILIDADLELPSNILRWVDMILHIVTLDIMDVKTCKDYLRKAMLEGVNLSKVYLIVNKYIKCKISLKDMMELYKEPLAYLESEHDGLPINDVNLSIPFEEEFYRNNLSSYIYVENKLKVTPGIDTAIRDLGEIVYPINKGKVKRSIMGRLGIKFS